MGAIEMSDAVAMIFSIIITGFTGAWLVFGIGWMRRKIKEM